MRTTIAVFRQEVTPNPWGEYPIDVEFPEFPSCLNVGADMKEAVAGAKDAITEHTTGEDLGTSGIQVAMPNRVYGALAEALLSGAIVDGTRVVAMIQIPYGVSQ